MLDVLCRRRRRPRRVACLLACCVVVVPREYLVLMVFVFDSLIEGLDPSIGVRGWQFVAAFTYTQPKDTLWSTYYCKGLNGSYFPTEHKRYDKCGRVPLFHLRFAGSLFLQ